MADWHSCQICYPFEINILLLLLLRRPPTIYFTSISTQNAHITYKRVIDGGRKRRTRREPTLDGRPLPTT